MGKGPKKPFHGDSVTGTTKSPASTNSKDGAGFSTLNGNPGTGSSRQGENHISRMNGVGGSALHNVCPDCGEPPVSPEEDGGSCHCKNGHTWSRER